jgi:hypothetical protein
MTVVNLPSLGEKEAVTKAELAAAKAAAAAELFKTSIIDARRFVGFTPSGASDMLAKLQEAANAAAAVGAEKEKGAILQLPPWIMELGGVLELDDFVVLWGHYGASGLKVGAGSNSGLVKSKRYNAGGANGGTEKVGIFNLELDGNFAGNPGAVDATLALDGIRPRVAHVSIKNGVRNLETIQSRPNSPGTEKIEDGFFDVVSLKDPQQENGVLAGPHDSVFAHFLGRSNVESFANIRTGGTAMGVYDSHCYGNAKYAWEVGSGELINCIGEGGRQAQAILLGDSHRIIGGRYFNGGGADGKIGIKFGNAEKTAFSSNVESVRVEGCINGAFDFTSQSASGSRITGWCDGASGTAITGSPSNAIMWDVQIRGGMQFGGTGGPNEIAAANEIEMPTGMRWLGKPMVVRVTGATEIKKFKTLPPQGSRVVLIFTSTAKITDGENLVLAGSFEGAANRTLELISDGTNMLELGRSAN